MLRKSVTREIKFSIVQINGHVRDGGEGRGVLVADRKLYV